MIPFNKPYLTGKETAYIIEAVDSGKISGNGIFTKRCQAFFEKRYGFKKALLTTSCTDALEMCAMLAGIGPGDEVIVPSFTFVSTALAFVRQGAHIVFADSCTDHPNMNVRTIEALITSKTKAIIAVHYAGVACDMDALMEVAKKHNLLVIEDAAPAIESFYKGRPLGSIGHLATFSFHETKNINSGEGGLLVVNDERFIERAEIIWEKGTNRAAFFRGEINMYNWVDTGSSFLPSEIIAAYLWAQINNIYRIQKKRISHWQSYYIALKSWGLTMGIGIPYIPEYGTNNGHAFYLICKDAAQRSKLIEHLNLKKVNAVFHYLSLHKSDYYKAKYVGAPLPNSDRYADTLLRLPMYFELTRSNILHIIKTLKSFGG